MHEKDLAVFRERPARIVDEALEPVDRAAKIVHRDDLRLVALAGKGLLKPIALDMQVVETRAKLG